ncbi:mandelate racemase/muconate lactonizing enzyme family protein [Autumnicola edwardsiae]|uniref:Mandelate racemase/muconate lactonizing enzyme family protein n=1 Tax=Autumnicola edwardsiae TaxID=3075594 RepID=A0ABU3CT49_9FLAO|nr:mandelate racemase/muconate lactonizing enzyme family protein [Zunongwangia sp. F297]MDT0649538.1 mandelate racemase/muconate lactonizing enzyme family protein [Zunongwangia sp. F297]
MNTDRRKFITTSLLGGGMALTTPFSTVMAQVEGDKDVFKDKYEQLDKALNKPVLKREYFKEPVIIDTLELLQYKENYICRVRSKDGATGYSFSNSQMETLYPIFVKRLQPFFIGKDVTDLESLLEQVYTYKSNYKLQSVALWVPLATIEFAILDMLGKISKKTIGQLIGEIHNPYVKLYQANSERGISAEATVEHLQESLAKSQAKSIKFKIGGRMSQPDYPKGRSEKLIRLARETFGDDMVISADSNGSYDVKEAIRIGKILEDYNYSFYEEPVPFDWYEGTKQVADALKIPVAGGEQEPSLRNFRWLLGNDALQVVQADMFYFGGMIRSMKVARMANVLGKVHTPHVSNIGYVYMLHFVSAIPNAGEFHELKTPFNDDMEFECKTSSLLPENGVVKVPTGPGLGINFDPAFIQKHKIIAI